ARRRQAIGLLEEITRRDPAAADDRLLLAQLREFTGDWDGARAEWDALLSAEPPRARDLIAHVEALLRNDLAARAGPPRARLEEVQPGAARNVQLRAQVLAARGREGDGVALLRDYAGAHPDQLLPVAGLLERMGHPGAAEPLYRAYVDSAGETSDPQATLVLAAFLGRQRRTAEALDLCQEAAAAGPPGAIASAATAILVYGYDEAQARRVEGWIAAMLDRAPGDPELRTAMAILRSLQGRADEARAIYEEMLAEDGDNLVALNNLAWLHAQGGEPDRALELIGRAIDGAGPVGPL